MKNVDAVTALKSLGSFRSTAIGDIDNERS